VDHRADLLPGQRPLEGAEIGEVDLAEGEAGKRRQLGQAVALQGNGVVVVEVVEADHALATFQEAERRMVADEPGRAGHEIAHERVSGTFSRPWAGVDGPER
jgi:hypothetical protein